MTGVLATIGLSLVIGYPLASWRSIEPSRSARLGLAYLFGTGTTAVVVFLLGNIPGGWNRGVTITSLCLLALMLWIVLRPWEREQPTPIVRLSPWGWVAFAVVAALVTGHGLFATAAAPIEIDFLENWGLKAKFFFHAGGVDWTWLSRDTVLQNHADYPPLVPMLFDAAAIIGGSWDDRSLGLFHTVFGLAVLLVVDGGLRREHPERRLAVPLAVVALAPLVLTPWIGLGEGPLIAYLVAGVHLLDQAIVRRMPSAMLPGSLLLGFAALTKNEGVALILAVAAGLVVAREPKLVLRIWPAAATALIWIVPRSTAALGSDLTQDDFAARFLSQLLNPEALMASLGKYAVGKPLLWLAIASGFALAGGLILRRERFRITIVGVQFMFYLAAYLVTPHAIDWHVRWSWERLVSHLTPLLAWAVISGVLLWMAGGKDESSSAPPANSSRECAGFLP